MGVGEIDIGEGNITAVGEIAGWGDQLGDSAGNVAAGDHGHVVGAGDGNGNGGRGADCTFVVSGCVSKSQIAGLADRQIIKI